MKNVNIFGENQVNFPSSPKSMGWGGVGCLGKSPIKMFWYGHLPFHSFSNSFALSVCSRINVTYLCHVLDLMNYTPKLADSSRFAEYCSSFTLRQNHLLLNQFCTSPPWGFLVGWILKSDWKARKWLKHSNSDSILWSLSIFGIFWLYKGILQWDCIAVRRAVNLLASSRRCEKGTAGGVKGKTSKLDAPVPFVICSSGIISQPSWEIYDPLWTKYANIS